MHPSEAKICREQFACLGVPSDSMSALVATQCTPVFRKPLNPISQLTSPFSKSSTPQLQLQESKFNTRARTRAKEQLKSTSNTRAKEQESTSNTRAKYQCKQSMCSRDVPRGGPRMLLLSKTICSSIFRRKFHCLVDEVIGSKVSATRSIAMLGTALMVPKNTIPASAPVPSLQRRWITALERARTVKAATGLPVHVVDCADRNRVAECKRVLERAACIWINGGNTFYLWYWMKQSGVIEIIKRRVLRDGVVYVGQSAGAIVAGKSIRTAFWKGRDNPQAVSCDWDEAGACDGMSLAPHTSIFPHYTPAWERTVEERSAELDHRCLTLKDSDIWVAGKREMRALAGSLISK